VKGTDHFRNPDIYEGIILKWNFQKYVMNLWTGFIWLSIRSSEGLL
jgi:hypothetical protein